MTTTACAAPTLDLSTRRRLRLPAKFVILGIVNFLSFIGFAILQGGDALNGESGDGRYLLSNHGVSTEVSPLTYYCSLIHVLSLFITHPLMILSGVYMGREGEFTTNVAANQEYRISDRRFVLLIVLFCVGVPSCSVVWNYLGQPDLRRIENRVGASTLLPLGADEAPSAYENWLGSSEGLMATEEKTRLD